MKIKDYDKFIKEDYVREATDYKLYLEDGKNSGLTLWVAYGEGSGTTSQIKDVKNLIV